MIANNLVLIAGMPRAGTTYLYKTLGLHPDIFIPKIKETNFFSYNYHKGVHWYEDLYNWAEPNQILLDVSPLYFMDEKFFERTMNFSKNIKVILIVRKPNEWLYSYYKQYRRLEYKAKSIEEFVNYYEMTFEGHIFRIKFRDMDLTGIIDNYISAFSKKLLLIDYSYFTSNKLETMYEIEKFMNISHFFTEDNLTDERINAGNRKNSKLICHLSTISLLRMIAFKILPDNIIHYIRDKYILGTVIDSKSSNASIPEIYDDSIFEKKYFSQKKIIQF